MNSLEFYVEQAAGCRRQADAATLANVRDRCLRSALAFEDMAARLRLTQTYRASDIARKAADNLRSGQ
jgi:hypothetical protein